MSPDTAFRESLFDALADDEGAAFWEGVYGQPIHTYSPSRPNNDHSKDDAENPGLERMTDDEYVAYVRAKMWEKSHGYVSGKREDVTKEEVERFYMHAPQAVWDGEVDLGNVLKKERVKWHPDKMQQRAGTDRLDEETVKLVTAVFQVVDRLWGEVKGKT
ncbi:MAG: hypothetical protein Q9217_000659 [Psora testacea]